MMSKKHKVTGKTGLISHSVPLSSAVPQHDHEVVKLGGPADLGVPTDTHYNLNENHSRITPTIGFNLDEFKFKNVNIKMWDLAGQERLRSVWSHYFMAVQGIIFVVDSADD